MEASAWGTAMRRPVDLILALCLVVAATAPMAAQSPEPPPYPDQAGVTFEPVGRSAWRVIESDLDCDRDPFWGTRGMAVAPDGRAWFLDRVLGIRQLGACPVTVEGGPASFMPRDQALASDGTLWVLDIDRLMSWGGSDWVLHVEGKFNRPDCIALGIGPARPSDVDEHGGSCTILCEEQPCYWYLDIAPDGTVWLSGANTLGAYDGEQWREYAEDWIEGPLLGFSPDGAVWVAGRDGPYVFYP
jgi:hypothetical protein